MSDFAPWECAHCGHGNENWRGFCAQCGKQQGRAVLVGAAVGGAAGTAPSTASGSPQWGAPPAGWTMPAPQARTGRRIPVVLTVVGSLVALFVGIVAIGTLVGHDSAKQRLDAYLTGSGWKTFTATDGQFTADFPTIPTRQTQHMRQGPVSIDMTIYTSEISSDRGVAAGFAPMPSGITLGDVRTALNGGVNGAAAATGANVTSSGFTTFLGYQAVDFVLQNGDGRAKVRAFIAGRTLYVLMVGGPAGDDANFDRFAGSFRLLGR